MGLMDVLSAIGSIVLIVLILILTYYATRWYARRMNGPAGGRYIRIIDRVPVTQGVSLVITQTAGKYFLLGVSDKNIQGVCELADFDPETPAQALPSQAVFGDVLRDLLDKAKQARQKKDDGGPQ